MRPRVPRKEGGLGEMQIPIVVDKTKKKSARNYGVLIKEGIALCGYLLSARRISSGSTLCLCLCWLDQGCQNHQNKLECF
ncbi:hypothetical protein BC937DRAFT_95316 [Endogone sp. FLAS-F59071]|nr:hypothetical protein BC937DRAFT_95316 [Endogone sp. FLAS-F59071]|eukprot:RUS20392.1 hypothetical protein BC937DRAFT_95316 [Endogone sp. FLAS-F59071]